MRTLYEKWSEVPIKNLIEMIRRQKAEIVLLQRDLDLMERILKERDKSNQQ